MKNLFPFLLFISISPLYAQFTEEDARLYSEPAGELLFSFSDSTSIYLGNINDGWYNASKIGLVKKEFFNEADSTIAAETMLYGPDKKEIGMIKMEVKALEVRPSDVLRWRKYVWVKIDGHIQGRDIYYKSIPEKGIEKILQAKNRGSIHKKLVDYFKGNDFIKEDHGEYTSFTFMDENKTIHEEKEFRVIVVFRGETALTCVITKDKPFELTKQKEFKENGAGMFYFLLKPSDRMMDALTDIAYSYIPL